MSFVRRFQASKALLQFSRGKDGSLPLPARRSVYSRVVAATPTREVGSGTAAFYAALIFLTAYAYPAWVLWHWYEYLGMSFPSEGTYEYSPLRAYFSRSKRDSSS